MQDWEEVDSEDWFTLSAGRWLGYLAPSHRPATIGVIRLSTSNLRFGEYQGRRFGDTHRFFEPEGRQLGAIARIDLLSDGLEEDITPPLTSVGYYYRITLPFEYESIKINQYKEIESLNTSPRHYWTDVDNNAISIHASRRLEGSLEITVSAIAHILPPTENKYRIDLSQWGDFQPTSIYSEGLTIKEFDYNNNIIGIPVDPSSRLTIGAIASIEGIYKLGIGQVTSGIATFDMPEFVEIDRFDYSAIVFYPAPDGLAPQIGQFLWSYDFRRASAFVPSTIIDSIMLSAQDNYSSDVDVITFEVDV